MKNISKLIPLTCMILSALSACNYLNKKPDNLLTDGLIWNNRKQVEAYLYQIYSNVNLQNNDGAYLFGVANDGYISITGTAARKINAGNWSPAAVYWDYWAQCYQSIRSTFIFQDNVDKCPSSQLSDQLKAQYKAEVEFLRGWYYWMLLRQYGPFVKLTHALSTNDNFNKYPRAPFDTCVAYINSLMDSAAAVLPETWPPTYYGKPTKGTCLAVKAEVSLLAASPLWNGNPDFANFQNKDGKPLASQAYDADKWKAAADAAKAVIDLHVYKLFTNVDEGEAFDPYLSYRDLFLTSWNDEIIFAWSNWQWTYWEHDATPLPGGFELYCATQNIVDAYYMANGRWITDPLSGYHETGFAQTNGDQPWSYSKGDWNMYANREPRFYASIAYNHRPVLAAPTVDDRNRYSSSQNQDGKGRIEFYYSGVSGRKLLGYPFTGYLPAKMVNPAADAYNWTGPYHPLILLRYAGILLDYVEALNEYDPSNPDITKYLDMIRTRAGVPPIEDVYPDAVNNKDKMRENILREREIELAFENADHWFTLSRRKMMDNDDYKKIYGMNVEADDGGQGFNFTGYYDRTLLQTRVFEKKMYLFPISQYQIDRDTALVQNPGW